MERGAGSLLLNQRKNQLVTAVTNAAEALWQASWSISQKRGICMQKLEMLDEPLLL
jgi:hypothetical protein